jgi:preprotein translocase SecE subunit
VSNLSSSKTIGARLKDGARAMWTEIRHRVTWPRPRELAKSSITIVSFVVFWAIYIGIWDYLFAGALNWLVK